MTREERRTYAREYARRQRARKLDAERMRARTCPRKFGRHGVCGAVLESDTVGGRLVVTCPRCERLTRGICADCPMPVVGTVRKARYCALHQKMHKHEQYERYRRENRRTVRARERKQHRERMARLTPEERERRLALKRAWRKANPRKVAEAKRREALRANEKRREYHRQYREARRAERAAREVARYHGHVNGHPCVTPKCGAVLSGRAKKCEPCKARDRAAARALLAQHYANATGQAVAA